MRRGRLAVLAVLAACGGGGHAGGDAGGDQGGPDASGAPPPPALGAQLDRAGRPGVGDLIVGALGDAGAMARRLAYGALADPAAWKTAPLAPGVTVEQELATNLAPIDAIDTGQTINMQTSPGCGNALAFRLPASATSYLALADLLADDQLYLDTSKPTCTVYLALELELASAGDIQHTSCGGRTLRHDALDALLSVVTLGRAGLDPLDAFAPRLRSTATAHPDITDTFPFLAAPNP